MDPVEKFKNYLKTKIEPGDSDEVKQKKKEEEYHQALTEEIDNQILSYLIEVADEIEEEEKSNRRVQKTSKSKNRNARS